MLLRWSLVGKKQKSKPLLSSSVSKTEKTLLEMLCATCKESSLIDKPSARSFFWWTSCKSRSSWFLLASQNFSTGPDTRRSTCFKRTRRCSFSKLVAATKSWRRLLNSLAKRNLRCIDDDNRSYRNICNMSFIAFSLAVISIIKISLPCKKGQPLSKIRKLCTL